MKWKGKNNLPLWKALVKQIITKENKRQQNEQIQRKKAVLCRKLQIYKEFLSETLLYLG